MLKKSKWLSLPVAVALAGTVLWGCSGAKNDGNGSASSPAATKQASASPAPSGGGKQDFGKVVPLLTSINNKPGVKKVAEYIQKETGVLLDPVYADDTLTKFNIMVTSKETVDFVSMNYDDFVKNVSKGLFMPLDDLIDKYGPNLKKKVDSEAWAWSKGPDGKIYGIPSVSISTPYVPMLRADWLKAVNLPTPKTVDEFEKALIAIKAANPSQSGKELYPLFLNTTQVDNTWLGSYLKNGSSWWKSGDGTYLPPEMDPEYKDYLATLQKWFKAKLIHPETFIITQQGKLNEFIMQNLVGATGYWYSAGIAPDWNKLLEKYPDATYVAAPLSGKYNNGLLAEKRPKPIRVVNANSKNAAGVVRMFDWVAEAREHNIISRQGLEGVHWNYVNKEKFEVKIKAANELDPNDVFQAGAFEILDLNPPTETNERVVGNPRNDEYYRTWDILAKAEKEKSYLALDMKIHLEETTLPSIQKNKATLDTAKQEAFIRIVTGEKPVSDWDNFLATWKKMGMDDVIKEKNEVYKKAGL